MLLVIEEVHPHNDTVEHGQNWHDSSFAEFTMHAECSGDEAVFAILTGEVLAGEITSGKMRLVQAWIEIHRDELTADWQLAVNGEEVFKIDPLK